MWVGHEKHCTRNTLNVKRSKIKVTRSGNVVAQKHRIYPLNSLGSGNASVIYEIEVTGANGGVTFLIGIL